jgi:hypothetical protein
MRFCRQRKIHFFKKASDILDSEAFVFDVQVSFEGSIDAESGMIINLADIDSLLAKFLASHVVHASPLSYFLELNQFLNLATAQFGIKLGKLSYSTTDQQVHIFGQHIEVTRTCPFILRTVDYMESRVLVCNMHFASSSTEEDLKNLSSEILSQVVVDLSKQIPIESITANSTFEVLNNTLLLNESLLNVGLLDPATQSLFEVSRVKA